MTVHFCDASLKGVSLACLGLSLVSPLNAPRSLSLSTCVVAPALFCVVVTRFRCLARSLVEVLTLAAVSCVGRLARDNLDLGGGDQLAA